MAHQKRLVEHQAEMQRRAVESATRRAEQAPVFRRDKVDEEAARLMAEQLGIPLETARCSLGLSSPNPIAAPRWTDLGESSASTTDADANTSDDEDGSEDEDDVDVQVLGELSAAVNAEESPESSPRPATKRRPKKKSKAAK